MTETSKRVVSEAHSLLQYLSMVEEDLTIDGSHGTAEDIADSMAMIKQLINIVKG